MPLELEVRGVCRLSKSLGLCDGGMDVYPAQEELSAWIWNRMGESSETTEATTPRTSQPELIQNFGNGLYAMKRAGGVDQFTFT